MYLDCALIEGIVEPVSRYKSCVLFVGGSRDLLTQTTLLVVWCWLMSDQRVVGVAFHS